MTCNFVLFVNSAQDCFSLLYSEKGKTNQSSPHKMMVKNHYFWSFWSFAQSCPYIAQS